MKFDVYKGRIFLRTEEYSDFHMKSVPVERFITHGEALRLEKELKKSD